MNVTPTVWEFEFDLDEIKMLAKIVWLTLENQDLTEAERKFAREILDRIPFEFHPPQKP